MVASVLLASAAGLAVHAITVEPPPGVAVVVAANDLAAGRKLTGSDLAAASLPPDAVPVGALSADDLVGRALSSPARRGEPLTDARLVGPSQLTGAPAGTVAVPVALADASAAGYVRAGDTVRVIAGSAVGDALDLTGGEPAGVIVDRAVVLSTPISDRESLLGSSTARQPALLLAMSTQDAVEVADASGRRQLIVAVLP